MALIVFTTIYGKHTAKPLETVDVTVVDTDILENKTIPVGTNETNQESKVSPDAQASDGQTDDSN